MCATCGCGDEAGTRITLLGGDHEHHHDKSEHDHHHPLDLPHDHEHHHSRDLPHDHEHHHSRDLPHDHDGDHSRDLPHDHEPNGHRHEPPTGADRVLVLEQQILAKNVALAQRNRGWLAGRGVFAINLMSSPGSGKTTLLERTIREMGDQVHIGVIEGDQETPLDAERIRASGRPVVQINTGAGCHLDADMVHRALTSLDPPAGSLLFIENVGNLVCPALFDLGESRRVVLTSVTEGADKPLKYPQMFRAADLVLINKMDLLPYVDFDIDRFTRDVEALNPNAVLLSITATSNTGIAVWVEWLRTTLNHSGDLVALP